MLICRSFKMSGNMGNLQGLADKAPKTLIVSLTYVFEKYCQLDPYTEELGAENATKLLSFTIFRVHGSEYVESSLVG